MDNEPDHPFFELDEYPENRGLMKVMGSRPAFELLRDAVNRLLDGDERSVLVGDADMNIACIEFIKTPEEKRVEAESFGNRCSLLGCLTLIVLVAVFALFGLKQFVELYLL
ncbi:hypothetical protein [Luteolibacter sp. LG18]|uniref:hypothetical protein n=1 Tax=Luteolibacter sp. LG18 TaxID=2819286 RepID=UPI002B28C194|nr:hypothetical protein llg_11950 [Luteolibacter sp. LG18]